MEGLLEILGKIGFDWPVALANLVSFLIIFYILKRFAFGPIGDILAKRKKVIDQGLEDAERAKGELVMAEESRKQKINEGKIEATEIVSAAREQEKKILALVADEAKTQARNIVAEGSAQVEADRKAMEAGLRARTAELVVVGIEKVLKQKLDSKSDADLVKKMIS